MGTMLDFDIIAFYWIPVHHPTFGSIGVGGTQCSDPLIPSTKRVCVQSRQR